MSHRLGMRSASSGLQCASGQSLPHQPFLGAFMNFVFENTGELVANGSTLAANELPIEPSTICEGIALLVSKDMNAEAIEMADLANALFPNTPSVLWMGALVAQLSQDWQKAHDLLQQLKTIQGDETDLQTYQHLVRVLRCMDAEDQAVDMIKVAMNRFPSDASLQEEYEFLISLQFAEPQNLDSAENT